LEEYNRHLLHKRYIIERLELFVQPAGSQCTTARRPCAPALAALGGFERA
jgi:hypothetical protein